MSRGESDLEYLTRMVDWLVEAEVTRQVIDAHPGHDYRPPRTWMSGATAMASVRERLLSIRKDPSE